MTSDTTNTSNNIALVTSLPYWKSTVDVEPLEGGITNHNYLVENEQGKFVVRLGEDIEVHQILRFNEIAAGTAAHAAGLSPEIRYHQEGVLVMDYVPSKALTSKQVQEQSTLDNIVELVQRCHTEIPKHLRGASVVFWVFHVIRDYAANLRAGNSNHIALLPNLLDSAELLEQAAGPFDIVFGHNDLLPANLLDDGERLWLIDWEYGGFNSPLFDLGGLASNNELDESLERRMLERYFEKEPDDALWYRYQAMKCASLLRETMWSMISEIHSTLDFDYSLYTADNLQNFEKSFTQFKSLT